MPRKKKIELRKLLPPIYCKGCNTYFIPKTRKQKYHNEECREAYYERTYWPKTVTSKLCKHCGSPFNTTKGKLQDYCHPDCREAARLDRLENADEAGQTTQHEPSAPDVSVNDGSSVNTEQDI